MAFELGVYSFGNTPRTADGGHGPTAQAVRDVLEAVKLAEEWAQYGHGYRAAWEQMGHSAQDADIAVAVHGFIGEDNRRAKADYLDFELRMMREGMAEIGRPGSGPPPAARARDPEPAGMVFAGGPEEVAERILHLHEPLGHSRQIVPMDVGGMPHATYLRAIELLGTEVFPRVRAGLNPRG